MNLSRILTGYYLAVGLAYQILFHGIPWPLRIATWLHVTLWPLYLALGLARWLFLPFAILSLLGLLAIVAVRRRTQRP